MNRAEQCCRCCYLNFSTRPLHLGLQLILPGLVQCTFDLICKDVTKLHQWFFLCVHMTFCSSVNAVISGHPVSALKQWRPQQIVFNRRTVKCNNYERVATNCKIWLPVSFTYEKLECSTDCFSIQTYPTITFRPLLSDIEIMLWVW